MERKPKVADVGRGNPAQSEGVERKLAAILAADVVGYSRLMALDEAGTHARLKALRRVFIDPTIAKHHGRIVKLMGDGALVEFASVVDAVQCAALIQRGMAERNAGVSDDQRIQFRIGVNLGDVIIEGDDIYGDGVNIAARLEGLAEPGGIVISGTAFDHAKNKAEAGFRFLGRQAVKNIPEPVRAYQVLLETTAVGTVIDDEVPNAASRSRWPVAAAVLAMVVIAGGGAWLWQTYRRAPLVEAASVERMAYPLPDKPSIAVLPFDNLSGDPDQDVVVDGITESMITTLSKVPNLFVIARNSTFTYKDRPVMVQQVAEELGVRFVLKGSVQRSGDRVRITAQLIDALTGRHLWAENYDRKVKDIFDLQDDITEKVITELQVQLTEGEMARIWRRQTDNAEAYEVYLIATELFQRFTKPTTAKAQQLLEQAVALDPKFADAWARLAWTYLHKARWGWIEDTDQARAQAAELAQRALAIDETNGTALSLLADLHFDNGEHDEAIAFYEKAIAFNPNHADMIELLGSTLAFANRPAESVALIKQAMRLSPYYPSWYLLHLGDAYYFLQQYDEAIAALEQYRERNPDSPHAYDRLAYTYAVAGQQDKAQATVAELLKIDPSYTINSYVKARGGWFKDRVMLNGVVEGLRKAGLPE